MKTNYHILHTAACWIGCLIYILMDLLCYSNLFGSGQFRAFYLKALAVLLLVLVVLWAAELFLKKRLSSQGEAKDLPRYAAVADKLLKIIGIASVIFWGASAYLSFRADNR